MKIFTVRCLFEPSLSALDSTNQLAEVCLRGLRVCNCPTKDQVSYLNGRVMSFVILRLFISGILCSRPRNIHYSPRAS